MVPFGPFSAQVKCRGIPLAYVFVAVLLRLCLPVILLFLIIRRFCEDGVIVLPEVICENVSLSPVSPDAKVRPSPLLLFVILVDQVTTSEGASLPNRATATRGDRQAEVYIEWHGIVGDG